MSKEYSGEKDLSAIQTIIVCKPLCNGVLAAGIKRTDKGEMRAFVTLAEEDDETAQKLIRQIESSGTIEADIKNI